MNVIFDNGTHKIESTGVVVVGAPKIRKISTGAMQRRFTVYEEMAIEANPLTKIIRSRLLNAAFSDLDYVPLIEGMGVIVNMLLSVPNPLNPNVMLVDDASARLDVLLADGTADEQV